MKSAYELAMERLEKQSGPGAKLSDNQKREIAEVDSAYRAKIAEREIFLNEQLKKARAGDDAEAVESLEKQLAQELRRLRDECEAKKERVRKGSQNVKG